MEKFSYVQRGQNIILTINESKKTKVIVDKVQRDAFISAVKEIIASKRKDETKEKELLKLLEGTVAVKQKAKEAIIATEKIVKEIKKAKKETAKKETVKKEEVKAKTKPKPKTTTIVEEKEEVLIFTQKELDAMIAAKIDEAINGNYKKEKVVEEKPRTYNRREY